MRIDQDWSPGNHEPSIGIEVTGQPCRTSRSSEVPAVSGWHRKTIAPSKTIQFTEQTRSQGQQPFWIRKQIRFSICVMCLWKRSSRFKAVTEDLLLVEIQQQVLLEEQQSIAFGGDYHFWNDVHKPFVGHVISPGMSGPRFQWDKLSGIYCMCQSPSINAHLHRTIAHKCIRSLNNRTISEMDARKKNKTKKTDSAALAFLYGIRSDFTLI